MCWNVVSKRQLVILPDARNRQQVFIYQYNMGAGYILQFPFAIDDLAETSNGVIILSGNSLYRWSFDYADDNGTKISTKLVTRMLRTEVAYYTRKYNIYIDGEANGEIKFTAGKQSWTYKVSRPKHLKYLFDTLNSIQLTLTSDSQHSITTIVLYSVVK